MSPCLAQASLDLLQAQAVTLRIRAYVLVNNRAEGNTPMTIQALMGACRPLCGAGPSRANSGYCDGRPS